MSRLHIENLTNVAIDNSYAPVDAEHLKWLQQNAKPTILKARQSMLTENLYYKQGLAGSHQTMYARFAVVTLLEQIAEALPSHLKLIIYDTFRTIATQKTLFSDFYRQIQQQHPQWNAERCEQETRKFVSHPTDPNHFKVPLHNSGGAVDLAIIDRDSETSLDFGTDFDAISDLSATDFFERDYTPQYGMDATRWLIIRRNRRLLFNMMKQFGFTNYAHEWWHYDLGTCEWARVRQTNWFYPSMEAEIGNID